MAAFRGVAIFQGKISRVLLVMELSDQHCVERFPCFCMLLGCELPLYMFPDVFFVEEGAAYFEQGRYKFASPVVCGFCKLFSSARSGVAKCSCCIVCVDCALCVEIACDEWKSTVRFAVSQASVCP